MNYQEAMEKLCQLEEEVIILTSKIERNNLVLQKRKDEWEEAKNVMYREKLDVDKLDKVSLSSIFTKISGSFDEKHEKEYQEYINAKRKYDEFASSVEDVKQDIERLQRELLHKKDEIKKLKNQIRQEYPEGRVMAEKEEEEKRQLYRKKKEIEEAISASQNVLSLASQAKSQYESAKSWSTYDTFFNGGLISDMIKYNKIDSAADLSNQLQFAGERMKKELNDVSLVFDSELDNMDSGTRFFDIAFDNIFTDWNVRNRLCDNINQLERYIQKVQSVLRQLRQELMSINQNLKELN